MRKVVGGGAFRAILASDDAARPSSNYYSYSRITNEHRAEQARDIDQPAARQAVGNLPAERDTRYTLRTSAIAKVGR